MLHTIQIEESILLIGTVFNDHLTLCIKRKFPGLKRCSFENLFIKINRYTLDNLVVIADIIVSSANFNQLICGHNGTVYVELIVNQSVSNNHLTFSVKSVYAYENGRTVGELKRVDMGIVQINTRILNNFIAVAYIIVFAIKFYELIAFEHKTVLIKVVGYNTGIIFLENTVFIEDAVCELTGEVGLNFSNTSICVVVVKVIFFAADGYPVSAKKCAVQTLACPPIGQTNTIVFPTAFREDIIHESIFVSVNFDSTVYRNTEFITVICVFIHIDPTELRNTINVVETITAGVAVVQTVVCYSETMT